MNERTMLREFDFRRMDGCGVDDEWQEFVASVGCWTVVISGEEIGTVDESWDWILEFEDDQVRGGSSIKTKDKAIAACNAALAKIRAGMFDAEKVREAVEFLRDKAQLLHEEANYIDGTLTKDEERVAATRIEQIAADLDALAGEEK